MNPMVVSGENGAKMEESKRCDEIYAEKGEFFYLGSRDCMLKQMHRSPRVYSCEERPL